jgi:hypothetical protein
VIKQITGLEPNPPVITQKSNDILASLINNRASEATTNLNRLLAGQGLRKTSKASNAIRIEDLVKKMNGYASGGGLRLA